MKEDIILNYIQYLSQKRNLKDSTIKRKRIVLKMVTIEDEHIKRFVCNEPLYMFAKTLIIPNFALFFPLH